MSLGRFPGFDDDPFFTGAMPSMGFPSFPMFGHHQQLHRRPGRHQLALMDPFSMFDNMDRMMSSAFSNPGAQGGHFYSSSSVMSYSHNGDGEPKIYQATSSVTQGPGGVKETRKSEYNSDLGKKKLAIGHHIGDRSHSIEKKQDLTTRDIEEHQEFINLDESDAANFDQEWQSRIRSFRHGVTPSDSRPSRRGIGLPSIDTRSGLSHDRVCRSRSPEKIKHRPKYDSSAFDPSGSETRARRREYLKGDVKRDKNVRF